MADWLADTPWWVAIGIIASLVVATIKVSRWTGRVDATMASLGTAVSDIREKLDSVLERLTPAPAVTAGSPLRLTSLGQRMRDQIGAGRIADQIAERLRQRSAGMSAYDIQELAFSYVKDEWAPDAQTEETIKQCAFDNGSEREEVLSVIAVEVRDRLLPNPPATS